jgi:membrane protease YdiL (CAAX protease family)
MDSLTLYLNALMLSAAFFPAGTTTLFVLFDVGSAGQESRRLFAYAAGLLLMLVCSYSLDSTLSVEIYNSVYALAVGGVSGLIAISAEIFVGYALIAQRFGRRFSIKAFRVERNSAWEAASLSQLVGVLVIAILEELTFRSLWFDILGKHFSVDAPLILLITTCVYAINHSFFGVITVAQKAASGFVFGCSVLYCNNVVAPIVAHAILNGVVMSVLSVDRRA